MNRYSKIKLGGGSSNTHKSSRSMDFSDLQSIHENFNKPIEPISPKSSSSTPQQSNNQITKNTDPLPDLQEEEVADNHGNSHHNNGSDEVPPPNYGVPKLTRNGSVSASIKTASKRFMDSNRQQSNSPRLIGGMQSVVKRAFSMRRSSSVSERYCRIHDQCVTLASPLHDDDDDGAAIDDDAMQTSGSGSQVEGKVEEKKKKKKQGYNSGRLLKACKKFLRL